MPILHLDIKAENVLLETNNSVYPVYPKPVLTDFGVSHLGTEDIIDTKHYKVVTKHVKRFAGTPGWVPPVSASKDT